MEDKFREIQKLWKSQGIDDLTDINVNKAMENVFATLLSFEKKQLRINVLKIVLVSLILLQFVVFFYDKMLDAGTVLFGVLLLIASSVVFALVYMKNQFKIKKLNMDWDSISFISQAVKKLEAHLIFFKKAFWIFALVLLLSQNIIYFDIFSNELLENRIIYHLLASGIAAGSFLLGIQFRVRKHKKEYIPLIAELKKIKTDLENEVKDERK